MSKLLIHILSVILFLFCSCNSYKELIYLQDVNVDESIKVQNYQEITIQPYDMLFIVVSSETPELAFPFNLSSVTYSTEGLPISNRQQNLYYTVNKNGDIDLLTLGEIHVEGLTKEELAKLVKDKLIEENYINKPVVTVQPVSLKIYVTGEVFQPGVYEITKNYITILEALAMAGDLTIYGKRNNIKVIRERNGERKIYNLDLTTKELFNSPAYYLQQNDVVYVAPVKANRKKLSRYK
ncbi:MAG: polysaccharide biosynthesis/export family protein [Bacteroidales bacterium]|nr:polysaccharide biosynthesis/export family protein [Bacteroidales bacterium]